MKVIRALSVSERLAAMAGVVAALASIAGFIPGVYRDPNVVIAQSHGFDIGNLIAVLTLGLGLTWSIRGSVRGRLVAVGALGYLLYSFVTYAFLIVLNAATLLYIAVLGFGVWSFITGFASLDDQETERLAEGHLYRRLTAGFMIVIAALFALTWLREITGSVISGKLPAGLAAAGWPMNPPYVLDLGLVIPIAVVAALRLLRGKPGGVRLAVPFLTFVSLLSMSVLLMTIFMAIDGQPLAMPLIAVFVVALTVSAALAWVALRSGEATVLRIVGRTTRDETRIHG
ncbi:MAG TPA: hypothetical protein VFH00_12290 [Candidatus Nitrosotalea sp.]|nr:hypothetical protein [Candidatus Nitrosotalea sp.]